MKGGLRDLLLFFIFAGVPIVSFWLQIETYPETPFFLGMLLIFLVMILWLRQYHQESDFATLVDYDENLHAESFMWIALGIIGAYTAAAFITSQLSTANLGNVLWIPSHEVSFKIPGGGFQLSPFWGDILFMLVLQVPAEELCKLALHVGFYMRLKPALGAQWAKVFSIGAPIFFWAMLHVYRAYTGPDMFKLLLAAFIGGLIIFAVMWKTKSVLAAIIVHFGYNAVIYYMLHGISVQPIPTFITVLSKLIIHV